MKSKSKKEVMRNYHVVMLHVGESLLMTIVSDEDELVHVMMLEGVQHIAIEDRNLRIHVHHNFNTMNSFELISACGEASSLVASVLDGEIMDVYCEFTRE